MSFWKNLLKAGSRNVPGTPYSTRQWTYKALNMNFFKILLNKMFEFYNFLLHFHEFSQFFSIQQDSEHKRHPIWIFICWHGRSRRVFYVFTTFFFLQNIYIFSAFNKTVNIKGTQYELLLVDMVGQDEYSMFSRVF